MRIAPVASTRIQPKGCSPLLRARRATSNDLRRSLSCDGAGSTVSLMRRFRRPYRRQAMALTLLTLWSAANLAHKLSVDGIVGLLLVQLARPQRHHQAISGNTRQRSRGLGDRAGRSACAARRKWRGKEHSGQNHLWRDET